MIATRGALEKSGVEFISEKGGGAAGLLPFWPLLTSQIRNRWDGDQTSHTTIPNGKNGDASSLRSPCGDGYPRAEVSPRACLN
jgi:hypothetical protein